MRKPTASISDYMATVTGFTSGFDYLRLILAISVLVWHTCLMTSGHEQEMILARGFAGNIAYLLLPMFFSLSGFLVTASLLRNHLGQFLWLRVVRLFPALTVEVVLSALVLGPLATSYALHQYFNDPLFGQYFLNVLGIISFRLPGVFTDHPVPGLVNLSLWTIPFELECYIALSLVAISRLIKRPRLFAAVFIAAVICITAKKISTEGNIIDPVHISGRALIAYFLAGVVIYLNRSRVPHSAALAATCACVGFIALRSEHFVYLGSIPIAYATIWLGLLRPKKLPVIFSGDYSYGIYLYAAPIQQSVYHFTDIGKTYWGNLVLSLVLTGLFSAFSWHAVEKPALKLKQLFKRNKVATKPAAATSQPTHRPAIE